MGSSRLPGKVLMPILGRPMIEWELQRLKASRHISKIVLLTSTLPADEPLVRYCGDRGIDCFRGSESDVLSRFHDASLRFVPEDERAETILIRLTGDCPLIDPMMLDEAIEQFLPKIPEGCRYFGYDSDLPDGMDFELFTWGALHEAYTNATDPFEKEHVTPFIWRNPERFGVLRFTKSGITPGLRFSVDYPEDLLLVEGILKHQMKENRLLGAREISEFLKRNPELTDVNSEIVKNEGLIKSALASPAFQVPVNEKLVSKYGLLPSARTQLSENLLEWARAMGVTLWRPDDVPADWLVLSLAESPKEKLLAALKENRWKGIIFETSSRDALAQALTLVCHTQYTNGS